MALVYLATEVYKEEKRLLNDLFKKKENQLLTGKMANYFHKNKPKPSGKLLLSNVKEKARTTMSKKNTYFCLSQH